MGLFDGKGPLSALTGGWVGGLFNGNLDSTKEAHFGWTNDIIWGGRENAPLTGHLWDEGGANQEDAVLGTMGKVADAYSAYRPEYANNQMRAAENIRELFEPSSQMLGEMTGGKYEPDLSYMHRQPVKSARDANAANDAPSKKGGGGGGGDGGGWSPGKWMGSRPRDWFDAGPTHPTAPTSPELELAGGLPASPLVAPPKPSKTSKKKGR